MKILNKEELRRQIREGKEISLDGILDEFKSLLRESIQTASEIEMDAHLGYEKHQSSDNPNYRNGTNKKTLKSKYGDVDVAIPRDREGSFEPQLVKKRETILNGGIILFNEPQYLLSPKEEFKMDSSILLMVIFGARATIVAVIALKSKPVKNGNHSAPPKKRN